MPRHLPNLLSALRLFSAPLAAWLLLQGHDTAAFCVFVFAGLSDLADGTIARRWGVTSRFGAWLDPAADKLLMVLLMLALLLLGLAPLWLVLLVLAADIAVVLGAAMVWGFSLPLKVEPLMIGKLAAAVQVFYVGAWLLLQAFEIAAPAVMQGAAYVTGSITLVSGLAYGARFARALFLRRRTA